MGQSGPRSACWSRLVTWPALVVLSLIFKSPRGAQTRASRPRAGYQGFTCGTVAVAAGDPQEARRFARRAEALLAEPPLTLLLSAQAAQIGGDELAAKKVFYGNAAAKTEFLGLRGLLGAT